MKLIVNTCLLIFSSQALATPHPFDVMDMVMFDRVSGQALSPDGRTVALQLRATDYAQNKGMNSVWTVPMAGGEPTRLTDAALNATAPRWSVDGANVYFLATEASKKDSEDKTADAGKKANANQLWRVPAGGGAAVAVSDLALDINSYKLSPDGKAVLLSIDLFVDCANKSRPVVCSKKRLDKRDEDKASGRLYSSGFVRHWDTWSDGRRSQLLIATLDANGKLKKPALLTGTLDGDVPSKPFGDDTEFSFSPDGNTVYFNIRNVGASEPWSTNFLITHETQSLSSPSST